MPQLDNTTFVSILITILEFYVIVYLFLLTDALFVVTKFMHAKLQRILKSKWYIYKIYLIKKVWINKPYCVLHKN